MAIFGLRKVLERLNLVKREIEDAVAVEVFKTAHAARRYLIKLHTQGTRSGRVYKVPGFKRKYRASAPGEPPAVATSNLLNNLKVEFDTSKTAAKVGVLTTENVPYALFLEYGTRKMAPRPLFAPTYKWLRDSWRFDERIAKAIKKVTR